MVKVLGYLVALAVMCRSFRVTHSGRLLRESERSLNGPIPPFDSNDEVTVAGVRGHSGFVQVLSDGSSMFYWLTEKLDGDIQRDHSPLIIWLQGGPGCSSLFGLLYELGPIFIDEYHRPQRRNATWASEAHLLFIDNPLGSGFSFAVGNGYVRTQEEMARNLYAVLQELCVKHPTWFSSREVYIFGESYAGKYIPHIAHTILQNNLFRESCNIPLSGLGIGNGWVSPLIQTLSLANYSYAAGVIDDKEKQVVEGLQDMSVQDFRKGRIGDSNLKSIQASDYVVDAAGGVNMYNIRIFAAYDFSAMSTWLSLPITKQMLHVPMKVPFLECGYESYMALDNDEMLSATHLFPDLLSHLRILVYTGQDDLLCNVLGTSQYLSALCSFPRDPPLPWVYRNATVGHWQHCGNLTQLVVLNSGHMVPKDQPEVSVEMLRMFLRG